MSVLTENIVLSRAKAQDLNSVRKLNCWGSDLTDVSIVRKMAFVEVLSLSVNNISTLADFSYCPNLQELYLRKNNIKDLSDVCFLKCLPHLRSLWLSDNPCAERNNYRLTVLRALPNLKRLDNILVQPDEVVQASISGDVLESPNEVNNVLNEAKQGPTYPHFTSPEVSTIVHHISKQNDFGIADEQIDLHSTSIQSLLPCKAVSESVSNPFSSCAASPTENIITEVKPSHITGKKVHPSDYKHAFQARVQTMVDHPDCRNSHLNSDTISDNLDDQYMDKPVVPEKVSSQVTDDPDDTASTGDGYLQILKRNDFHVKEEFEENFIHLKETPIHSDEKNSTNRSFRRIMNSNILSAVLCLVKELDFASLQVVKTAVHCRMDEMSD